MNDKPYTLVIQCRKVDCKYYNGPYPHPGGGGCRLKDIHIDKNGHCIYLEEIEPKINIKNSIKVDREYVREKIMPLILDALDKMHINLNGAKR